MKRCNKPFWYIKPEDITELRQVGVESQNPTHRKLVEEYLSDYEKVMNDFKKSNSHMFKRKETFSLSGFKKLAYLADTLKDLKMND